MSKKHIYVGMDVHKETTVIAMAQAGRNGRVEHYGTISSSLHSMRRFLERNRKPNVMMHFVYEAGPTGFALQRRLEAWNEDCIVLSAVHVPKKAGDRVKTDRRDAEQLARMHRSGELEAIRVPDSDDEAIRDLARGRFDAKQDQRRSRLRLKSFLLRNGYSYSGKTSWNQRHRRWLRELGLQHPAQKCAMEEYVTSIDQCGERISRIELQLQLLVVDWRMYPLVEALMALKGFAWLSATVIASELGDLRAYETPRHLMSYLGLITSEHTTGERVRKGSITKSGNSHARFFIVESSQHYCKVPKVSKELTDRQAGVSERIREISWNAQNRLYKRCRALGRRGVMGQKIQVALARELVGFVWAVGQEVEYGDSKGLAQGKGGKRTPG